MNLLELFCGTKSITKVFRGNGHNCLTLDIDFGFNPDFWMNILDFQPNMLPPKFLPDIIWASPPCECFSVASIGKHWSLKNGTYLPKTNGTENAILLVKKTLDLINQLNPKYWFIENPRCILRKLDFMKGLPRRTVTYCQYGDTRMKPTDIWTNCDKWIPKTPCKNGDTCHEAAPRGAKTGTQGLDNYIQRAVIPKQLCVEILGIVSK